EVPNSEIRKKSEFRNPNRACAGCEPLVLHPRKVHGFLQIEPKIKLSSLASCQSTRALSFRFGSAVTIIPSQYFVSFDSFRQVPMLFLKSFFETASSASQ